MEKSGRIIRSCLFLSIISTLVQGDIKIGAFNIQNWGWMKDIRDPIRNELLPKIVPRYDMIFVQEIMDPSYLTKLVTELNKVPGQQYNYSLSDALGTTKYKEHYGFVYRTSSFKKCNPYQYKKSARFERPPYGIVCDRKSKSPQKFGFLGIHVKPKNVKEEMFNLYDAYKDFEGATGVKNVVIGGDLNFGRRSLIYHSKNLKRIKKYGKIFDLSVFKWLIDVPTMVHTPYAHDRFILVGDDILKAHNKGSEGPYFYCKNLDFNGHPITLDLISKVSDHWPIEVTFE